MHEFRDDERASDALAPEALRAALTHVTQAVAITDATGAVVFWNSAAEDIFGHTAQQALGIELRDLIIPAHARPRADQVIHALQPDTPFIGELTVHDRAGRTFEMWASLSYVRGNDGQPAHFIAVCVDLTEIRNAARQNEMLASIVASSQDGIISVDRSGSVVWANPAIERILGWKPADIVGQPIDVIVPPGYTKESEATRQDLLRGAELQHPVEVQAVRHDGLIVDVSVMVNAYRDTRGNIVGTSAAIRDITGEVATRRELEAMVARHTAQFEQVSLPQAFLDLAGTFQTVNDAFCDLAGRAREDLIGTSYAAFLHPVDDSATTDERAQFRSGPAGSATYEVIASRADGRTLPVLVDAAVLHDADDRPYGIAVFARDLSEVRDAEDRLNAQENFFRALNRRASDAAVVTDVGLNIVYVSPSVGEVFGYEPEDVVSLFGLDFVHPDDREAAAKLAEEVMSQPDASARLVLRLRDGHGRWRWVEETVTNCLTDPDIGGLVANLRDVTTEVEAQQALQQSEARYRAIAETAQEGIMVVAPDGQVLFANQMMATIVGRPLEDIYQEGLLETLEPEDAEQIAQRIATRQHVGAERYEVPYRHPNGELLQLSVSANSLSADDGTHLGSLAMVADVTETRRAEQQLRKQALHDALTGLPNRTLLVDRLEMATARSVRRETAGVAVLFMDLDNFKMINDSRGHDAGDQLLQAVAERVQKAVRAADTVARLGGDEFAVVCEDADVQVAQAVADRIQDALTVPFDLGGHSVYVSASIGVALSPPDDPSALLRHADAAMYKAKAAGRRGVALFDEDLASDSQRKLSIFTGLREAIKQAKITLHYQPIVDLNSGGVLGVESLLRWRHPALGAVSPAEAIACAGQAGLSLELDELVMATACDEMADLRTAGVLPRNSYVSVNISAKNVGNIAIDRLLDQMLRRSGLPPECVMIELTEDAVMAEPQQAVLLLGRLSRQGVAVAVDDFGTGYSSLAYLQRLPVSVLKIDRSFVAHVIGDGGARTIARSIVGLANALGLRVVAEGIETDAQAETMRQLGCHAGQGYLWSPAVASSDLEQCLKRVKKWKK